ncbi:hypothetical protein PNEG_01848 [Pneumocystis murina B123]|uniref:Peptidase M16 N-terminal domain-containing protein n=1 Tax=Pneumocystis murina (strain B123) TaxID=1069680 RepID=M7NLW2_PNEMU|nr:hypothetical protein PNEG_01848 [Pneumocystis murina B123]EMR09658.1 hypothetical protein PNEG_01848 [Pneumocystis murina B123]
MWSYFIFFSLIFLLKTESHIIQHNKTDHILYKRATTATLLTENIKKPEGDHYSYRLIQLSNGLKTLLISYPDSLSAGAALDVKVGHFSDPDDIPGVAHFCEHLLFMGTKKYPGEDDFSEYLLTHAGTYNAYTSTEDTNYFFSVEPKSFEKALDMFSQLFISPLILKRSVEREAHAVDLEHKKNLQNDAWRLFQLEKSISNPKSPYSKFGTGDYVTLVENTRKKGIDIASVVSKFFSTYYSSNLMKLVIFSSESLDNLEKLAVKYFTDIPNKNLEVPKFTEKPFGADVIGKQYWYKPIADSNSIELVFPIDTQRMFYKSSPSDYLRHFLDHRSYGSVFYTLNQRGWITDISVYSEYIVSETDALRINIGLTEIGLDNYEDILGLVFQFLRMLRDNTPNEDYFKDLIKIDDVSFRFKDQPKLMSYASHLASVMQLPYIEDVDLLRSSYLSEYDHKQFAKLLSVLRDDNYFLTITSKTKPGYWDLREPWYGSEYKVDVFSQTLLEKTRKDDLNISLKFPEKNIFIPELFIRANVSTHKKTKPTLMYNDTRLRYWYKEDDTFSIPKTFISALIKIPDYSSSPFETAHSKIYLDMLINHVSTQHYNAIVAGYSLTISAIDIGIYLSIYGFSDKILLLLDKVIESMRLYTPSLASFMSSRQKYLYMYEYDKVSMPYSKVSQVSLAFHDPLYWPSSEMLYAINSTTYEDVQVFHSRRFSSVFTEVLAVGLLSNSTKDLLEIYFKALSPKKQYPYQILPSRSYIFKEGSNYIYEMSLLNPQEVNSAILYSLQVGSSKDSKLIALLNVLFSLIRSRVFNQLRTEEQLSYVVRVSSYTSTALMSFFFVLQSLRDPFYLEQRINAFLYRFAAFIDTITDEQLKSVVNTLLPLFSGRYTSLPKESGVYLASIVSGFYDFDIRKKIYRSLKGLTKEDLKDYFYNYFYPDSATRKKLSIHLKSQTLESVSVRDFSPRRLQYYFKCNGLDISLEDLSDLIESSHLLVDFEKALKKFFTNKYPHKDVSEIVSQAFKYLKELYTKLKKDAIKNYDAQHFTDLTTFKNSLKLSPVPLPVMKWSSYY